MHHPPRQTFPLILSIIVVLVSLGGFASQLSFADSFTEHRIQVGLKLFRTLVNADLDIAAKTDGTGQLPITLLYANNRAQATDYQRQLQAQFSAIAGIPVTLESQPLAQLLQAEHNPPAAIFITQALKDSELQALVRYSLEHRIIVFSPFKGDVEGGVLAGLAVQATVQPLINMHTLSQGQFAIKPFYIKVAKHYE